MPSAEHWDTLAATRDRDLKVARGRRSSLPDERAYSSVRRRFYAYLLDTLVAGAFLLVGYILASSLGSMLALLPFAGAYLVWLVLCWRTGQSPAKQLMGMYVVHDGKPASWKRMAVREIFGKTLAGIACATVAYLVRGLPPLLAILLTVIAWVPYYFWMVFDAENRALWDQPCGTHVVEEREIF